ncbi:MAG: sodium-independent anion transporter [Desulfobacteraceae bacterium IS3]|nr:MAG: sodium-independent anion transporter [Desulfobacteraceae bacterium IS3]
MVKKIFPFLVWFEDYNTDALKADALAGLTVALVLIPQSMAYAQLAGMPPYFGLYAAFLPPMLASLFGSSRQLATGPVAVVSLMTSASLEPLATAGSEGYIAYAILLALMVGGFQFLLGVLRLGIVVNFLSHPVVNGFTNGAAIIIATSQLASMFGVYVDNAEHHYETVIRVCQAAMHYTHWLSLILGIAAFAIMYALKKINPKIPNVLVAVAVTTVISWLIGFEHNRSADISAIESPETREQIVNFNAAVNAVPNLAKERVEANKAVDNAHKAHDKLAILEAEYNLNVISTKIEKSNRESQINREKLRHILFSRAEEGGITKFYPKEKITDKEGRTWRIRVGNKPLDVKNLPMTGGGAVVGNVPKGLPGMGIPAMEMKVILRLFPFAAIISLLGFMEAISIAKAMAAKTGHRIDPNQELIGQGISNMLGAFSQSYPVSGSFSRSAVNLQAGAVSGLSSVFTGLTVVITLLFFTPLLYHLPQSVLAAVIMMAVIGLINVAGFIHAWRAQWYDGLISVLSFIFTLLFAPHLDKGIMIGVTLSLGVFLYKSMRPVVSSLSRHEDASLRDVLTHELMECPYVDLISFEGPLFFANASYLEDKIAERMRAKKTLKHIIIAANGINDMDASGEESLALIINNVRSSGADISFSGVNESVMKVFKRTHLLEEIGKDHIYPLMETAICAIHEKAHRGSNEDRCPLLTVCRIVKQELE